MKFFLIILLIFSLTSCNNFNFPLNYNSESCIYIEPNRDDIQYYIDYYNVNLAKSEEVKVDEVYKDFGGYRNIRLIWFISVKGTPYEKEWYSYRYKDLYFTFDYGDVILMFIDGECNNWWPSFFSQIEQLNESEIRDFHSRYWEFVYSEREKGNL